MIDYEVIINGVVAGLTTEHLINGEKHESIVECLKNIEHALKNQYRWFELHMLPPEEVDIFRFVPLAKATLGAPFTPNTDGREYTRILVPIATVLSINGPFGIYTFSIAANTWTPFDLPDRSTVILDSTNTASNQTVYIRYTNQKP